MKTVRLKPPKIRSVITAEQRIIVVDRSGSMAVGWDDLTNSIDTELNEVRKAYRKDKLPTSITLVAFDTEYTIVAENIPIQELGPINWNEIKPRGFTALRDAMGTALKTATGIPESTRVIFTVFTDGGENASKQYTSQQIQDWVKELEAKPNWTFVMLGAEIDAWTAAQSVGFANHANSISFNKSDTKTVYAGMTMSTISMRDAGVAKSTALFENKNETATPVP